MKWYDRVFYGFCFVGGWFFLLQVAYFVLMILLALSGSGNQPGVPSAVAVAANVLGAFFAGAFGACFVLVRSYGLQRLTASKAKGTAGVPDETENRVPVG